MCLNEVWNWESIFLDWCVQKQLCSSIYFKNLSNTVKVRLLWMILVFGEVSFWCCLWITYSSDQNYSFVTTFWLTILQVTQSQVNSLWNKWILWFWFKIDKEIQWDFLLTSCSLNIILENSSIYFLNVRVLLGTAGWWDLSSSYARCYQAALFHLCVSSRSHHVSGISLLRCQ